MALSSGQLETLIAAIEDRYGFRIEELTRLGGELDVNFRADAEGGERWFVRLTPSSFDPGTIAWQNAVLRRLLHHPLSVEVPRLLHQLDGESMSRLVLGEDEFVLRMTSWVPGSTMADLGETDPAFRIQLGTLAAEVVESLEPLSEVHGGRNEHHWMVVRGGHSIRSTIDAVGDPARRALIEVAAEWFDAVEPHIAELPQAVVHQDLHDFNLLAERDAGGRAHISGVVDFNDAVYTARIAELAVAAVYAGLRQSDAFEAFCQVVEGYLQRAELTEREIELLYPLAVTRLAVNASTWAARGKLGNTVYAESRTAATWPALEQLLDVDPRDAEARFREIRDHRRGPGVPAPALAQGTAGNRETEQVDSKKGGGRGVHRDQ